MKRAQHSTAPLPQPSPRRTTPVYRPDGLAAAHGTPITTAAQPPQPLWRRLVPRALHEIVRLTGEADTCTSRVARVLRDLNQVCPSPEHRDSGGGGGTFSQARRGGAATPPLPVREAREARAGLVHLLLHLAPAVEYRAVPARAQHVEVQRPLTPLALRPQRRVVRL